MNGEPFQVKTEVICVHQCGKWICTYVHLTMCRHVLVEAFDQNRLHILGYSMLLATYLSYSELNSGFLKW